MWPQPVKGECAESCADLCGSRDPDGFVRQSDGSHMPHSREQLWGSTLHETVHQNRTCRQNVAASSVHAPQPLAACPAGVAALSLREPTTIPNGLQISAAIHLYVAPVGCESGTLRITITFPYEAWYQEPPRTPSSHSGIQVPRLWRVLHAAMHSYILHFLDFSQFKINEGS